MQRTSPHVKGTTTVQSCGDVANTAYGAVGNGNADVNDSDVTTVDCSTPTPSPSPTPGMHVLFGGVDQSGNNIVLDRFGNLVVLHAFSLPLGPDCPDQQSTFDIFNMSIGGDGSVNGNQGGQSVEGAFSVDVDGHAIASGSISVSNGVGCDNTVHFDAEVAGRALLQGDINCSWTQQFQAAAADRPGWPDRQRRSRYPPRRVQSSGRRYPAGLPLCGDDLVTHGASSPTSTRTADGDPNAHGNANAHSDPNAHGQPNAHDGDGESIPGAILITWAVAAALAVRTLS